MSDQVTRRRCLALVAITAGPACLAQAAPRRLAFLAQIARPQPMEPHIFGSMVAALRELGWVEGRNLTIDWRFGNGDVGAVPALAASIAQSQPDAVVAAGTIAAIAMRKATTTLPVVFGNVSDPLGPGLVHSLNNPGTNMTGVVAYSSGMMPKLLELLLDAVPRARDVALLVNPLQPSHASIAEAVRPLAGVRNVRVRTIGATTGEAIEAAFAAMARDAVPAAFVPNEGLFIQHRRLIAQAALKHRVALATFDTQGADDGALLSYGADQHAIFRTVASYADRVLKGARPQDLPVQQPTTFQLVVNRATERQLQLTLPQSLLLRADRVVGG